MIYSENHNDRLQTEIFNVKHELQAERAGRDNRVDGQVPDMQRGMTYKVTVFKNLIIMSTSEAMWTLDTWSVKRVGIWILL